MGQGIQIYNENGVLMVDTSTRVSKFLASANTNGANTGSFTVSNPTRGPLFYMCCPSDSTEEANPRHPYISITAGNPATVSWEYEGSARKFHTIYIGAY